MPTTEINIHLNIEDHLPEDKRSSHFEVRCHESDGGTIWMSLRFGPRSYRPGEVYADTDVTIFFRSIVERATFAKAVARSAGLDVFEPVTDEFLEAHEPVAEPQP